jgi:TPR repeat protein
MNRIVTRFLILALLLFLISCASKQSVPAPTPPKKILTVPSAHNSINAVNPRTYSLAYKRFYQRAQGGDAVAQNNLGHMYFDGRGVAVNYKRAVMWLNKAAAQGNAEAQVYLGVAYWYGRGVTQDPNKACSFFAKAHMKGSREGGDFLQRYCLDLKAKGVEGDMSVAIC